MEIGRAIRRIELAFRRNGDRMLERYGLTVSQMNLMLFLFRRRDEGVPVIQRDIEQALNVTNPTVSGMLDRLEKNGFILRRTDPANRRTNRVVLTQRALDMGREAREDMDAFSARVFSPLSPEEQELLGSMLERILKDLPGVADCNPGERKGS